MNKIMLKQILLLISVIFLVTGCNMELKRSANNKLFDTKGFDGGKRRPVYNNKYIDRAKRNIIENNYDEEEVDSDEPDEYVDPYTQNRIMYSNMVKTEQSKKSKKDRSRQHGYDQSYPDIGHAKDIALSQSNNAQSNAELKNELAEIKTMLSAAKKDLVKYKCPLQEAPASTNLPKNPVQPKAKPKKEMVQEDLAQEEHYEEVSRLSDNEETIEHKPIPSASDKVISQPVQQVQEPVSPPVAAPNNANIYPQDDDIVDELPNTTPPTPSASVSTAPVSHTMINLAPSK